MAVFIDKSKSTLNHRVQQPEVSEFRPLIDMVQECGGELAVGLIRQESNQSLLRLNLPLPPVQPQERWPSLTNRFQQAKVRSEEKKLLELHERRRRAWLEGCTELIGAFERALQALLDAPVDAMRTDIWGALHRLDLYLAEPIIATAPRAAKFGLLITDGIDDAKGEPVTELRSDPLLLLINGSGSIGDLGPLQPLQFESLRSALRYLEARRVRNESEKPFSD